MAKTVFNKEVHLLLRQGKVSVVPWDRLIESLKQEVQYVVSRNTRKESSMINSALSKVIVWTFDSSQKEES